jgi:hypothetical protein
MAAPPNIAALRKVRRAGSCDGVWGLFAIIVSPGSLFCGKLSSAARKCVLKLREDAGLKIRLLDLISTAYHEEE